MVDDGSDDLPPGWVEHIDPRSGKSYYFNAGTNTTSWKRPTSEASTKTEEKPSTPEEEEEEESLPPGWVEHVDSRSGKKYYYNKETKTTSWKHPSSSSSSSKRMSSTSERTSNRPSSKQGLLISQSERPLSKRFSRTSIKDEENNDNDLPPGWVAHMDPFYGKTYYFNAEKNISSWKHPSGGKPKQQQQQPRKSSSTRSSSSTFKPIKTTARELEEQEEEETKQQQGNNNNNDTLPPGWYELLDENSKRVYYYNEDENKTSWEKPSLSSPKTVPFKPATNNVVAAPAPAPAKKKKKQKEGPLGCYLVYESHSGGRLVLQYSKGDIVPDNPVGMFIPGEGYKIQPFKFTQNNGKTELIKGIAGGDANRRKYYVGWCQFIKLARQVSGMVIKFPCPAQGVEIDIYGYRNDDLTSHFIDFDAGFTEILSYGAIAVMPRNYDFLRGVRKVLPNYFLEKGNIAGIASVL